MSNCVFCKIINKEIPTEIVFEDETVAVFPDLNPSAPIHLLIVPKSHFSDFMDADLGTKSHILEIIASLISKNDLSRKGYRIIVNGGGAALVPHLHFHLLGEITINREV